MYKHLYDSFKHWYCNDGVNQNTIYFYSDPHFADEDMKLRKNYIGDEEQVKSINKRVGKNDTLVILGDLGNLDFVKKIRAGRKILIMGNHDKGASNYIRMIDFSNDELQKHIQRIRDIISKFQTEEEIIFDYSNPGTILPPKYIAKHNDNKLFDEVYEGVLMISPKIMLSHEPVNFPFAFNIHGHDHSNWYKGKNHLNLCAEHINYTPVSINEIVKSGALSKIQDIHRTTIDKAVERKGKKK